MGMITFGPGSLYFTMLGTAVPQRINAGFVNEFSIEEAGEVKSLYGQTDYALAVRRSTVKCTGKAKNALMSAKALNVFNNNPITAGTQTLASLGELDTVPASGTYTVVAANGSNFNQDLGVIYQATGTPLLNVGAAGSLTAAGQYAVSAGGTYTFDSLDASAGIALSYAYQSTTSGGFTKITSAQTIGTGPIFQVDYVTKDPVGGTFYFRAYAAVASKLSRAFKITDFMMPELDFEFAQNSAGIVYMESYSPLGA